jgi:hypothetical protein
VQKQQKQKLISFGFDDQGLVAQPLWDTPTPPPGESTASTSAHSPDAASSLQRIGWLQTLHSTATLGSSTSHTPFLGRLRSPEGCNAAVLIPLPLVLAVRTTTAASPFTLYASFSGATVGTKDPSGTPDT